MTRRSLVQRSAVILALVGLSAFLFYIGKGHTLILDTNAVTIDGKEFKSADAISVSIDGKEPEPMGRAERIMATVGGPKHRILIQVDSGDGRRVEKEFRISTWMDTALVSIPAILGDAPAEYWITRFVPPPMEEAPAEQMQQQVDTPETPAPAAGTPAPPAP
jgi:hypothetical protein